MLCLRFRIDDNLYGFEYEAITEMTPLVPLTALPGAPDYVPGYFNYRGLIVPVIDLCRLIAGRPAARVLSSRIAVVKYRERYRLGLLLEQATEVTELGVARGEGQSAGIRTTKDFLDDIFIREQEMLQLVNTEKLLSEPVRAMLFTD